MLRKSILHTGAGPHQKKALLNAPKGQEGGKYRDADLGYSVGRDFPMVNSV